MIFNTFLLGPENWASYDYHASIISGGHNVFIIANWEEKGGAGSFIIGDKTHDAGFVWADNTRWSPDIPENPISILPLLTYTRWTNVQKLDLTDAYVEVYLRGQNLDLKGGKCLFWICGNNGEKVGRWKLKKSLKITDNKWGEPIRFQLINDENKWYNSWNMITAVNNLSNLEVKEKTDFNSMLSNVVSYGFSFEGFKSEPTGALCISKFIIEEGGKPC